MNRTVIFISLMLLCNIAISQQWTVYNQSNSELPENTIRALAVDEADNKWIGTDNGLAMYDGSNWTIYNDTNSGLPGNIVRCIAIDGQGDKWIGTTNGLAKFDGSNWTVYQPGNSDLPDNLIKAIDFDSYGDVWVGTTSGIGRFDGTNWYVYSSNDSSHNSQILTSENIPALSISNDDVVAVGTINGGLMYLTDTSFTLFDSWTTGLPDNTILCIAHDNQGTRWMGTPGAGILAHYGDHTANVWSAYNTWNSSNPSNSINTIIVDDENRIVAGSQDAGVIIYSGGNNWVNFDSINSDLPDNFIYSLALDKSGLLWVGTFNKGLAVFDYQNWVGINPADEAIGFNVYPNPSNGQFWVNWKGDKANLFVYDMYGRQVHQQQVINERIEFDLSFLVDGLYLIKLYTTEGSFTRQVVVTR